MRTSVVVAIALASAAAPALALPINEFGIAARASRYRRSPDMVDSIYARDEDETMLHRREPVNLSRLRIGVPVHNFRKRAPEPEPFVIFSQASANIPACRNGLSFCGRSLDLEDELD
ncbi:hypothetical protein FOMPIDRAFT_1025708 [Fomitopsis schrenkii]|uniref:Uncharacterized protein n=1 Tax=Fomitopsis schrenkii TaxID=2126942 RepID=S8F1G4_FOMSC|nr:hypothetical protein FOMPIDRAFT_1025708 [Fomitopsis schrenkii]